MINTITFCLQGISTIAKGIYNLFNRMVQCCKGKPKVKKFKINAELIKQVSLQQRNISSKSSGRGRISLSNLKKDLTIFKNRRLI